MNIEVLKERARWERRVGLAPAGVRQLVESGHRVLVARGPGEQSHFPDSSYESADARDSLYEFAYRAHYLEPRCVFVC